MASSIDHDPSTSGQDIGETLTDGDTDLHAVEIAHSNSSLTDNVDTIAADEKTTVENITISAPDDCVTADDRDIEPVDKATATQLNDSEPITDEEVAGDGVEGCGLEEGGAESDEEEKRAILADENILTLEESEKVRERLLSSECLLNVFAHKRYKCEFCVSQCVCITHFTSHYHSNVRRIFKWWLI